MGGVEEPGYFYFEDGEFKGGSGLMPISHVYFALEGE